MMKRTGKLALIAMAAFATAGCGGGSGTAQPVASPPAPVSPSGPGETLINEPGGLPAGYALLWSDEFNTDGAPNPANWAFDTSYNKVGWFNHELQYYAANRPENARVEGGHLVIEARKEALSTMPDWGGQAYSSAKLVSKRTWTYGYVEARALVPCPRGTWPAIWQLPASPHTAWPDDGEIDIMEYVGWNAGKIYQSVHTKDYYHVINTQKSVISDVADACNAWHVYQMTWTPERITMGFDGRNVFSFRNDGSGNYAKWPFVNPQYLILNLAVGGDFGGVQGVDDATLPWQMQVDYVRVYQKTP